MPLPRTLVFRLRLRQSNHSLALFELPALFHKLDALESLQHATLSLDCALALKAWMLTHGAQNLDQIAGKAIQIAPALPRIPINQQLGTDAPAPSVAGGSPTEKMTPNVLSAPRRSS